MPLQHLRVEGKRYQGRLARRLVTTILLVGVVVTLLATALQMLREYWQELENMEQNFAHIEQTALETLANDVWLVDVERLQLQVDGITTLEDFCFAEVVDHEGFLLARSGGRSSGSFITRAWDLQFELRGISRKIGQLTVSVQISEINARLLKRTWVVLLVYAAVVGIIVLLLNALIYRLFGRHLEQMAAYAQGYNIEKRPAVFALDRIPGGRRDELDDLAGAFNYMTRNLSETVSALQAEIVERKEAEQGRQMSEARFEQLASAIDQVFWLTDWQSGKVIYINPAYERIWGAPVERVYSDPLSRTASIIEEDRAAAEAAFSKADKGGFKIEYRIRRADGEVRTIYDRGYPIHDDHHKVYRVAGVAEDVTERKRLARELQKLNEELEARVRSRTSDLIVAKELAERSSRAKSAFLDNMSHELRTPLSAILGFSQLLERDPAITSGMRQSLEIIKDNGDKLLHLLNDLLEMANIESGRSSVDEQPFSPRDVAAQQLGSIAAIPEAEGLDMQLHVDPALPAAVLSDNEKFRQILHNLLTNAVKFTEQGTVVLSLEWLPASDGRPSELVSEVSDTGIGIARDDLRRIFNFFTQVGEEALNCGAGLGLAITRHYVDLLQGTIDVESEVGVGSKFTVYLPVQIAYFQDDAGVDGEDGVSAAQGGERAHELTAEDLRSLSQSIRESLLQAAVELDGEQVLAFSAEFKAEQPQIEAGIRRLIDNISFTALVRLLEASLE
ncbi:MAG: ATP-binding protein [Sedimenticola sp.]